MGLAKPSGSAKDRCPTATLIRGADVVNRFDLARSKGHRL